MPIKSRWTCDIPKCSLLTYLFTSPTHPLSTEPLFINGLNPDTHYLSTHAYRVLVLRIASGLVASGLQTGDRVLLFSGNNIFFPAMFAGIVAAGGVFTGANPGFTSRELAYQLQNSGAKFLITNVASIDVAADAAQTVGLDSRNVFVFDDGLFMDKLGNVVRWESKADVKGMKHWSNIFEAGTEDFAWEELKTDEEVNRTAAINYSSGTTGVPKGVEITHSNFISNAAQVIHVSTLSSKPPAPARWICVIPMYHAFGQTYYATLTPLRQIPTYILPKFDFLLFLSCIQRFRITNVGGVPPIMVALAKHPAVEKFDFSSLTAIGSGAAPLSGDIAKLVEGKVNKGRKPDETIKLKQGWGMTEATCSVMGFHPEEAVTGCIGELFPNCEGKVVNSSDGTTELPANAEGEIWIRAPNVMKGYYKNPKATAETTTPDGWLKTGDIGYYNDKGKWFIVDRKKELIKVKGNQVAPAELEGLLLEHPGIADAAVVGVLFAEDEKPRAYVVPKIGVTLTAEDVTKWVQERAVRYKWITGGVVFDKEIPRNPSGKILKRELKERAKAEVDASGYKAKL